MLWPIEWTRLIAKRANIICKSKASTLNKPCCRTLCVTRTTLRVLLVCYVRYARFPQMLCACVSLCLRSVGRSPSCAKMRRAKYRTQASVSAEKEKARKVRAFFFVVRSMRLELIRLPIRPSNVRVCLFRHDRDITALHEPQEVLYLYFAILSTPALCCFRVFCSWSL